MTQQSLRAWIAGEECAPPGFVQYSLWHWLRDSSRRYLLATELYKPLTSVQLCALCRRHHPRIRTQDVNELLRAMARRGLVSVVNERRRRGRLYYLTSFGIAVLRRHAGLLREPLDPMVDWNLFGRVLSGALRRALLTELEQPRLSWWTDCTPMGLKRRLLDRYPSGISAVARTLNDMKGEGLVEVRGFKKGTTQRLFGLTDSGRRILSWLKR